MHPLTDDQIKIIQDIEKEFLKINKTNVQEDDLVALVNNSLDTKRIKRKELEIKTDVNLKLLRICASNLLSRLKPLCDDKGFDIDLSEYGDMLDCKKWAVRISMNGYRGYQGQVLTVICHLYPYLENNDGIMYVSKGVPRYKKSASSSEFYGEEDNMVKWMVDQIISIMKSKI